MRRLIISLFLQKLWYWHYTLLSVALQKWDVDYSIDHMTQMAKYKLHAKIGKALKKYNIGVATGEHCHNRIMFKQFLEAGALKYTTLPVLEGE